jgi:hypothetical protein
MHARGELGELVWQWERKKASVCGVRRARSHGGNLAVVETSADVAVSSSVLGEVSHVPALGEPTAGNLGLVDARLADERSTKPSSTATVDGHARGEALANHRVVLLGQE